MTSHATNVREQSKMLRRQGLHSQRLATSPYGGLNNERPRATANQTGSRAWVARRLGVLHRSHPLRRCPERIVYVAYHPYMFLVFLLGVLVWFRTNAELAPAQRTHPTLRVGARQPPDAPATSSCRSSLLLPAAVVRCSPRIARYQGSSLSIHSQRWQSHPTAVRRHLRRHLGRL